MLVLGTKRFGIGALVALVIASLAMPLAKAWLPPRYGGTFRLPSNQPVSPPDPLKIDSPLDASLNRAVFDGLYRFDSQGAPVPALAESLPEYEGRIARIKLRSHVLTHAGRALEISQVVDSLNRAARSPRAGYLLSVVARDRGQPGIRAVDGHTLEIELTGSVDLARLLCAAPLAIAIGRRRLGTGPLRIARASTGLTLHTFRPAAEGSAYLDELRVEPPRDAAAEVRALELDQLDASWHGTQLFGEAARAIDRPARPAELPPGSPVVLIANSSRNSTRSAWGSVARSIDRARLQRIGLYPDVLLAPGLPEPRLPRATPRTAERLTLRLPVIAENSFSERLSEALAGMLDGHGYALHVEPVSPERYASTIRSGQWDLRMATLIPDLPGYVPMVARALVEVGGSAEAIELMSHEGDADDRSRAADKAEALGTRLLVLGHRRDRLFVSSRFSGAAFDRQGRLDLTRIHRRRADP